MTRSRSMWNWAPACRLLRACRPRRPGPMRAPPTSRSMTSPTKGCQPMQRRTRIPLPPLPRPPGQRPNPRPDRRTWLTAWLFVYASDRGHAGFCEREHILAETRGHRTSNPHSNRIPTTGRHHRRHDNASTQLCGHTRPCSAGGTRARRERATAVRQEQTDRRAAWDLPRRLRCRPVLPRLHHDRNRSGGRHLVDLGYACNLAASGCHSHPGGQGARRTGTNPAGLTTDLLSVMKTTTPSVLSVAAVIALTLSACSSGPSVVSKDDVV